MVTRQQLHCPENCILIGRCTAQTGEVITDVECKRRMREAKEAGEPHFYMMELGPGLIIDARARGNVARLINSSCVPNAESQKWHDAGTGAPPACSFRMAASTERGAARDTVQHRVAL
jgi:hypothetical protein